MKTCAYCGRQSEDSALLCRECGTKFGNQEPTQPGETPKGRRYAIPPLPPGNAEAEWVTLLTCRSLAEADFITSEVKGAGMEAMVPDQFMIQAGSYRVQVPPKDYETARTMLNEMEGEN